MERFPSLRLALAICLALLAPSANAHNVWAHAACADEARTVAFYHRAGDVYLTLGQVKAAWREANQQLETGVIAEFDAKLDPKRSLAPYRFNNALSGYIRMKQVLSELDVAVSRLLLTEKSCVMVKQWSISLKRILADGRSFPRASKGGVRYADAAGLPAQSIRKVEDLRSIMSAWRDDLAVLAETLEEVISGLRNAIPLAKKGEFASVMLSGRNVFGDKMPQFTDMFSAFERFYVMTVTSTIQATMEVYPAGYEWLNKK